MSSDNLSNVFLTLQLRMIEVIKCHGGNNYKIPHVGKKRLQRERAILAQFDISREVIEVAQNHLEVNQE